MNPSDRTSLRGLLLAQFTGAFNDNAWKLIVALLAIRHGVAATGAAGQTLEAASQSQTTRAFVAFTLPLLLVSSCAGFIADRLSKRRLILYMKMVEVGLMGAASAALMIDPHGGTPALLILAGMGVHSALFSPAKYGILPELLSHDHLASGNAKLELWTFVAIVAGTAAGGWLLDVAGGSLWLAPAGLMLLAAVGLAAAWSIPPVPPARAEGGLIDSWWAAWSTVRRDRILWLAILGSVYFWTIASLVAQNVLIYAKTALPLSDSFTAAPLAVLAVGTGAGALLAARLCGGKIEYGLLPLGSFILAFGLLFLGLQSPGLTGTLAWMTVAGLASGLLIVPLNALIQWRTPADRRGAVIALANLGGYAGILAGSLGASLLSSTGLPASGGLVTAALLTMAATVWALWLVPDACVRLVLILLTHTVYRLRIVGRAFVPPRGGALLLPNHVSFVDGLLLLASLDRPIRFIVAAEYYEHPLLKPLARAMGVIPISPTGGPRAILRALRDAGRYLDDGDLVCLFPEGQITRTGMLLPFQRGFTRIVKGRTAPIIPIYLDQVWGSIFSFAQGRFFRKWPKRIPYTVTVMFGEPLPPDSAPAAVRQSVMDLAEQAWRLRDPERRPLHDSFVRSMRRHPFRLTYADAMRPHVSSLEALVGAIALARALRRDWSGQERVGILLPSSVGGALVNVAASLSGRTSVNLNYTAGTASMGSAARQAGLHTVVTSRLFVEKASLSVPQGLTPIWIEDLRSEIGRGARLTALLLAIFAPIPLLERSCGARRRIAGDDLATIIFSSGSTAEPKGVMLTHANVGANVEGAAQILHCSPDDRLLGILPFFHSFGYMATLWFAADQGLGVIFHPNPLDVAAIGALIERYRITYLIATPTFLQLYMRRCTPDQFGSLRVVLTGAEKQPERLTRAFEEKFGIRPIEGYGTTECAPVIAVGSPGYRAPGFFQAGSRVGTVGRPLPGISVRIVDPETFAPLPTGSPGMLLVRGPNVMRGYLDRDDLTNAVMRDGWYVTGDIAVMDDDGFLQITDRLSRFSKIGGEMVPHGLVEEALHDAIAATVLTFAVTAVPDEKKGEQLVVLHTLRHEAIPDIVAKLAATGLPNLYIPRIDYFVAVDQLPLLGTGKLDLKALKRIALERLQMR